MLLCEISCILSSHKSDLPMLIANTLRPLDTRPQAAQTLTMKGPKNLTYTNLCSENL